MSLFDIFTALGVLIGLAAGSIIGAEFGFGAASAGACIGAVLGYYCGRAPWVLSVMFLRRTLEGASVAELRAQIAERYFISHLIIRELIARGAPVESFREAVSAQLRSDSADVRRFGQANARLWFPDLLNRG